MKPRGDTCFEVLDALGLARLVKRTPDLDGAVPLRVAQACNPLLEGNAFGFQITLQKPLEIRRSLGRLTALVPEAHRDALAAAHRAALARLVAQGYLARDGAWHRALKKGLFHVERRGLGRSRIRLWTGLLVRPDEGIWLRVSGAGARRNLLVEIDEAHVPDEGALVPLILGMTVRDPAPDWIRLEGEIATIAPVAPGMELDEVGLAGAEEVGRAHTAFYDAAYFAAKKGAPTRKYRRLVAREEAPPVTVSERARIVVAGPSAHTVAVAERFDGAAGPGSAAPAGQCLRSVVYRNLVPFEARFDGHTLSIEPDKAALAEGARAVEEAWAAAFGPAFVAEHRGALWYLTKYFTPHPSGEAHFFVKPWTFVQTPAGWSSLLEGVHGDGYDVMRGVVSTDVFFATPAVFRVHRLGEPIRVGAGVPLLNVMPIPRRLLRAGFREVLFRDVPGESRWTT